MRRLSHPGYGKASGKTRLEETVQAYSRIAGIPFFRGRIPLKRSEADSLNAIAFVYEQLYRLQGYRHMGEYVMVTKAEFHYFGNFYGRRTPFEKAWKKERQLLKRHGYPLHNWSADLRTDLLRFSIKDLPIYRNRAKWIRVAQALSEVYETGILTVGQALHMTKEDFLLRVTGSEVDKNESSRKLINARLARHLRQSNRSLPHTFDST